MSLSGQQCEVKQDYMDFSSASVEMLLNAD